jgi:hypothetical protein
MPFGFIPDLVFGFVGIPTLSIEDKQRAFIRATKGMSQAAERWAQRAATGLTDEQLADALKYELGIFGGSSATDNCPALTYQGNGLKIWRAGKLPTTSQPSPRFKEPLPSPWPARCTASATRRTSN